MNPLGRMPIHKRRNPKEDHEGGIPRRVKEVTRQEEVGLLDLPGQRRVMQR